MTTPDTTPSTLSPEDSRRILQTFGRMPFGAHAWHEFRTSTSSEPRVTVDHLVAALESLATTLRDHGTRHENVVRERDQLLSQRDAVRAFLGTDQL